VAQLLLDRRAGEPFRTDLARAHEGEPFAYREDQRRCLAALEVDRLAGRSRDEGRHVFHARQGFGLGEPRAFGPARVDADRLQPLAERAPLRIEPARAADIEQPERRGVQRVGDQPREGAVHRAP